MNEIISNLVTVRQFCARHDWPPYGGLRWLIFNAEKNGFEKCIVKIGRNVLIDEKAFFKWAESHRRSNLNH